MAGRYGLQIRAAVAADAEGIADLLNQVGVTVAPASMADRLEAIRRSGCGSVLLAVEWGPPTGLLAFHWHPTIGGPMPLAQVDWLVVAPDERRRGIARTLLKAASQAARMAGCGALSLVVPSLGDASLQLFCTASGFEPNGASFTRSLRKTKGDG